MYVHLFAESTSTLFFFYLRTASVDFFANVDSTWTFTPSNPEQCISLFIADDIETEGTETFSASFEDDQGVTQEAIICIIDNEERKYPVMYTTASIL